MIKQARISFIVLLFKKAYDTSQTYTGVILDLTVPGGIGGQETIKRLLEIDPNVKAFISSGYADGSLMANYKKYGFIGALAKPYSLQDLQSAIYNQLLQ